ncbi:hypothetical protein NBRC3222_1483 [Acetobacter pasteurianus NBRC 3222]|nr:hypothetical protein NBRC3222_1483 [Acetobacter pasteurianus NBRC 3222]
MAEFLGKKVLVIGGSRGIGAAIVKRLTHDGASGGIEEPLVDALGS